jgi:glycine/D-amino acid oxidase-like deaminating enzyme
MTNYHSPWIDQFPSTRVPAFPRHRGATASDVVIIGAGLTGCATAYALAAAGAKVMLLEAAQVGRGSTGSSSGWINEDPGIGYADLERLVGGKSARRVFQSWRRAALDFAALMRRLDVKCFIEARPAVTVAMTPDQVAGLKREQQARRAAGVEATLLNAHAIAGETALQAPAALRSKDGAILDPYRACLGLAVSAANRGAAIFERTPVTKITFNRKSAEVITATGRIQTSRVIVTTGMPTPLFKALVRHFWFRTAYFALTEPVPARIRQQLGTRTSVLRDSAVPAHVLRWTGDGRVLVSGADADAPPVRLRDKVIVQRTGQLMYELSTLYPDISGVQPAYGWASDYARTANGLPCIGPHRNYPHHLFALGDASQGVTGAYLASRVLVRQHSGEMDPTDNIFEFHR